MTQFTVQVTEPDSEQVVQIMTGFETPHAAVAAAIEFNRQQGHPSNWYAPTAWPMIDGLPIPTVECGQIFCSTIGITNNLTLCVEVTEIVSVKCQLDCEAYLYDEDPPVPLCIGEVVQVEQPSTFGDLFTFVEDARTMVVCKFKGKIVHSAKFCA